MEQKWVKIGEVDVPIIIDECEEWFPISYITTKVLLKSGKSGLINKNNKEKYSDFIKNKLIEYSYINKQETKCINKMGLIKVLGKIKIGWLTPEQITIQNELHKYLDIELLPIKNDDDHLEKTFNEYKKGKIKRLPLEYDSKESYIKMLNILYGNGKLNVNNLTLEFLMDRCGLKGIYKYLTMTEVYQILFGEDFHLFSWKYPNFKFKEIELTYDIANHIAKNYIKENEITIENIFTFNFTPILRKCGIMKLVNNDLLYFLVQFYEFKYAGYKFKTQAINYYTNENNLLFDLRYLIENDLKIDIEKIPLYLTKTKLRESANSMYHFIVTKGNGSIYEWVNKLYPNKFSESDFEINAYRNIFGSDKEFLIDEILRENFKNVIYNQIHTERTIQINGMVPDWLIFSDNGVWIVEYFGLYEERLYGKSSRVTDYINKTKNKIERYKEIEGYRFIFLYPNDTENDLKGCREIIAKMKENPYVSMV